MTTFAGLPIHGDIVFHGRDRKPQRTAEEFGPIVIKALNAEGVKALRWRQYTPYFNDGEPCHFSAWGATVAVTGFEDYEGDDDRGFLDEYADEINGARQYNHTARAYETTQPTHPCWDAYKEFADAVDGGEFLDVLLQLFGDHAEITVTRDGIDVEFYDHD